MVSLYTFRNYINSIVESLILAPKIYILLASQPNVHVKGIFHGRDEIRPITMPAWGLENTLPLSVQNNASQ